MLLHMATLLQVLGSMLNQTQDDDRMMTNNDDT